MGKEYPISSISRHRLGIDGQGIRTLVVVQECPLRCKYCLNPFTWNGEREATKMTAKELYDKVNIDRLYMLATGGGITFGGGEPLLYPDLITEMRDLCDSQLAFAVETSLNVPWKNIENVITAVDEFVVDIKTTIPEKYMAYTGGDVKRVLSNLKELIQKVGASKVVVRIPIIPEFTDEEDQNASRIFLQDFGIERFDLFRYRVEAKKTEEKADEKEDEDTLEGMAILGEEEFDETMDRHVEELDLSNRTKFILRKAGIDTVYELKMHSAKELMKIRLMEQENLDEIVAKLAEMGMQLKEN